MQSEVVDLCKIDRVFSIVLFGKHHGIDAEVIQHIHGNQLSFGKVQYIPEQPSSEILVGVGHYCFALVLTDFRAYRFPVRKFKIEGLISPGEESGYALAILLLIGDVDFIVISLASSGIPLVESAVFGNMDRSTFRE